MLSLNFDLVPLARELVAAVRDDLREIFVDNCVVGFLANTATVLAISAYEAVWIAIDSLDGTTAVSKTATSYATEAPADQLIEVSDSTELQSQEQLPATDAAQAHQCQENAPTSTEELPPCAADFAFQMTNISFTLKVRMQCDRMATIFASVEERVTVIKILSAVHGLDARLCFRTWLVPYTRMLLVRFDGDETRAFAHIVASPHLYASLQVKSERATWCWTRACAGCNKPRHKFDDHDDEIRGTFTYI